MRNQWSVSSHDGAMARYTMNTLLTSLIGLKERCVICGEKPNKYIWQDIPQSMRPLHNHRGVFGVEQSTLTVRLRGLGRRCRQAPVLLSAAKYVCIQFSKHNIFLKMVLNRLSPRLCFVGYQLEEKGS